MVDSENISLSNGATNHNNNNNNNNDNMNEDHNIIDGVEMQSISIREPTLKMEPQNSLTSLDININQDLLSHINEFKPTEKTGIYVTASNLSFHVPKKAPKYSTDLEKRNYLLNNLNFDLIPGQMTLLMGAPSSGKSVLLKLLADRLSGGTVEGSLLFNGHQADHRTHQSDTIYVPQEDRHIALLTVKETLDFSAQCNMPSNIDQTTRDERVELILQQLGLSHTKNTIVGNEFFRGISGGQKRRVTIAAEFTKCPNLILMDEPTSGLDSAIAFSVISKIKTIAQEAKASVIISLLQPSPELTNIFDNVLLLCDKGNMAYFGERENVLPYFKSIGLEPSQDQPLAEFMQDVLEEPKMYQVNQKQLMNISTDSTTNQIKLDQLFKQSKKYEELQNITTKYTNLANNTKFVDHKLYPVERPPIWYETKLLIKRQIKIMKIIRQEYFTRFLQALFMGFVVGSLFFQMDDSQADAQNRFGLMYFSMVLFIWTTYGSIDEYYNLRGVFYDQKDGKYYRNFSYFITLVITKIPISLIEALLYSVVCYWTAGFRARADSFIVFVLCMMLTNFVSQAVFQMVSALSESQLVTSMVTPAIVVTFMVFSGYMLPGPNIPKYWVWVYYLSPLKYLLDALASNELHDQTFTCKQSELIPPTDIANQFYNGVQICPRTNGDQFLEIFGMNENYYWRWIDIVISIAYSMVMFFIFYMGIRFVRFETKKPPSIVKNVRNKVKKDKKRESTKVQYKMKGCYMTFEELSYTVNVDRKNTQTGKQEKVTLTLLNKINGYIKPGLTALMGASGAGKSTLLDVLSKRKNAGIMSGMIKVNGVNINDLNISRFTAYVEQQDILSANLTIREAIEFSSNCRLPSSYSNSERAQMIDDILKVLNLTKMQHTKIGFNPTMGISLANRKKVSIGIELASDPHLLFLDEPTSSLDSSGALKVMNCIRRIAETGRTVICTIHQPSQQIFEQFDQLLMLCKGEVIYFGETGEGSKTILNYFEGLGYVMEEKDRNPSDYILEIAEQHHAGADPITSYIQSPQSKSVIQELQSNSVVPPTIEPPSYVGTYAAPMSSQLRALLKRAWFNHIRRPTPIFIRFLRSIVPALIVGTMFLRLDSDQSGARNKLSMIFLSFLFAGMASIAKIPLVVQDRAIYYRDSASGCYPSYLYMIASFITDLPLMMMTAFCFWIPFFWLTGLDPGYGGWKFFFTLGVYLMVIACYDTMATMFALVLPTTPIATLLCGMGLNFLGLFGGFFIPKTDLPEAWKWMHYFAFTRYGLETLSLTEMIGQKFSCPNGEGEVLIQVNATTSIPYCPIQSGEQMIARYGFNQEFQFKNVAILAGYIIGLFTVGCLALRYIKHMKR
ncbi:ABC transporter G family protein [Cavenderia fasciculata]|uniref:ABC transporter G family protein n=1 Tax=Cavenderia fasciculata TaxID=261658 RepID=F4PP13_CACFS|nr:ABC transporter G family protein [Cavenderia fasciculata]EGG22126.1 ABC transporter G family protein [Cavenderia fasciculata]|eukprot:XP_004359977.1 ABC transporter G family protein [Cavenderia fasciculata]